MPTTTLRIENTSGNKCTERVTVPQGMTKIRYYAFRGSHVFEDAINNLSGDGTSIVVDYFFNFSNQLNTKVYIDGKVYTTYNNRVTIEITYGTSVNRS